MGLQEYNRKRDFARTSEPRGAARRSKAGQLAFVVQLHHARARHYDLRLEMEGVLRSWAVPRGPSFRPGEKRLAVETEDHPMSYSHFSGVIPEGEYGAGHMAVFDQGTWQPDGDPVQGYQKGHLDFALEGGRLKGRWTLIRTGQRGSKSQWMLFKRTDSFAADMEADDLIGDLQPPPSDAPGASTRAGLEIRARKGFSVGDGHPARNAKAGVTGAKRVSELPKAPRIAKKDVAAASSNKPVKALGPSDGTTTSKGVGLRPRSPSGISARSTEPALELKNSATSWRGKVTPTKGSKKVKMSDAKHEESDRLGKRTAAVKETGSAAGTKRAAGIKASSVLAKAKLPATSQSKGATPTAARIRALKRDAAKLSEGLRIPSGQCVAPMLTVASAAAPASEDWIHEWKWDGYRILAQTGDAPRLWSRNGIPWNERAPHLAELVRTLSVQALIDGELIAVDAKGYSDFNALQRALKGQDARAMRYVVFDLLALDGHDLRQAPLLERKSLLERLFEGADARLFYSTHIQGHGPEIFEAARNRGMEGIISKRVNSTYEAGRSREWLKTKTSETREFVVVGYTPPKGARQGIGALMLARFDKGSLVYAGRVGSGMGNAVLLEAHRLLRKLEVVTPVVEIPAHVPLPPGRIQWVEPSLVVEVIFRGWGKEGLLRQASFHRLRDDKPASPAQLEQPEVASAPLKSRNAKRQAKANDVAIKGSTMSNEENNPKRRRNAAGKKVAPPATADSQASSPKPRAKRASAGPRAITSPAKTRSAVSKLKPATPAALPTLSSPDRVVYPGSGFTKRDVWDYYLAAAPQLLGEIGGRLLSIVRCPEGIEGQHFFQKHVKAAFGASVKPFRVIENDGDAADYFYVDDIPGLMALVQMNALEIHPWGSRIETLELPDRMVFDLDPDPSVGWPAIKSAAKDVRDRLLEAGLESFPKLSGGKGVHVVVPLKPKADWEQVRRFAEAFADAMEAGDPDRYVATMSKAKRRGRIFIDWLRNGRGATSVASWSLRARPGAPAAVPLSWAELSRVRSPTRYTLKDAALREVPPEAAAIIARAKPLKI